MIFYGLVSVNGDPLKPFYKCESYDEARGIQNEYFNISVLKYSGYKRSRKNGGYSYVIQNIV